MNQDAKVARVPSRPTVAPADPLKLDQMRVPKLRSSGGGVCISVHITLETYPILCIRQRPQPLPQQPPEPSHRSDLHPLIRRMRALDDGPEGDHVHAGKLLAED